MGTHKTRITLDRVPLDISEDHLDAFFSWYGHIRDVTPVISKAGIDTGDFVYQITCKNFLDIPNMHADLLGMKHPSHCQRVETTLLVLWYQQTLVQGIAQMEASAYRPNQQHPRKQWRLKIWTVSSGLNRWKGSNSMPILPNRMSWRRGSNNRSRR